MRGVLLLGRGERGCGGELMDSGGLPMKEVGLGGSA